MKPLTLRKETAPAYWARWAVYLHGQCVGYVQRPGGFAPWKVYDPSWSLLRTMMPTRKQAIDVLIRGAQRKDPR